MSLLFRRDADLSALVPPAPGSRAAAMASGGASSQGLRVSAMWACLRLRADQVSTMPLDVYRSIDGRAVEVTTPPVLQTPAAGMLLHEWLYSSQFELDRYGNAFGQIVARDGWDRPAQIELSDAGEWSVRLVDGQVQYRRKGKLVPKVDVWHERQFTVPGVPVGLSPVAFAAWTLQHNLSAQEFAVAWFDSGAAPAGVLRNTRQQKIDPGDAAVIKSRFKEAVADRGVFVTGQDWDFSPAAAAASDAKFLDAIKATTSDVCRYFGVPGDLVDAEVSTGSITYANVVQRNLQFLVMNLAPALTRRERVFTAHLLPQPWFARFNTDALLRLDPAAKIETLGVGIEKRIRTPDEVRDILDLPPLTDADYAQFDRLFPQRSTSELKTGAS